MPVYSCLSFFGTAVELPLRGGGTETPGPTESKIFTIWPFAEKLWSPEGRTLGKMTHLRMNRS